MPSTEYYRAEAKRGRELASQSVAGSIMADRWRTLAAEYETLADAIGSAAVRGQTHQQPMQQQQHKTTEEDK